MNPETEVPVDGPTLTVMELEAAHLARFDLGPGYPQLPVPDYVTRLYLDDRLEAESLLTSPNWTPQSQARMDQDLDSAVRRFIDIVPQTGSGPALRTTFTGSVALDRVISAIKRFARSSGAPDIDVVTTTPSIDIMRLFLEEHAEITPHFVESRKGGVFGTLNVSDIVAALRACHAESRTLVCLLTSPENPTGETWSKAELSRIASECVKLRAVLVVDHCFIVAGVQGSRVPRVWDIAPPGLLWMSTWDTGKTFGLNEDKLGFVLSGDERLTKALDEALAVMQFGVARRQKLFFTRVIGEAIDSNYLSNLRKVCRTNLRILTEHLEGTKLEPRAPRAGSLALVDVSGAGKSDEEVRRLLLKKESVGVIAGNVFFHSDWKPRQYIRVALARPADHFEEAVRLLVRRLGA